MDTEMKALRLRWVRKDFAMPILGISDMLGLPLHFLEQL